MPNQNEATIRRLYAALEAKDGDAMAACYASDATFKDPVFPDLKGPEVGGMWRMLTAGSSGVAIEVQHVAADSDAGSARFVAMYNFSRSNRPVRNAIHSTFAMRDGLILHQVDSFSFWRWSRQALGAPGWLLGWTPLLRSKVRKDAAGRLARYMAEHPAPKPVKGAAARRR